MAEIRYAVSLKGNRCSLKSSSRACCASAFCSSDIGGHSSSSAVQQMRAGRIDQLSPAVGAKTHIDKKPEHKLDLLSNTRAAARSKRVPPYGSVRTFLGRIVYIDSQ